MKKIVALLLGCCTLLFISACNQNNKNASNTSSINPDVKHYVSLGQLPDYDIKIGMSINESKSIILEKEGLEDMTFFERKKAEKNLYSGDNLTLVSVDEKEKIDAIISYTDIFNLDIGIAMPEDVIASVGETDLVEATEADTFFFIGGAEGSKFLKYSFGSHSIRFYFINDFLTCSIIYKTSDFNF